MTRPNTEPDMLDVIWEDPKCPCDCRLRDPQFRIIADYVEQTTGIQLPEHKHPMVQSRLAKRVRALSLPGFPEYVHYVFDTPEGISERVRLVDALTTNKTDFFREGDHFEFLTETALPTLLREDRELGATHPLIVWSAGCATGEEAYTLAMVLAEQAFLTGGLNFLVHATDICEEALERSRMGIYDEERIEPVPERMRRLYLRRSKNRELARVRVSAVVRRTVRVHRMNLVSDMPPFQDPVDIAFCRNVLIYFDRDTQLIVLSKIARAMRRGGYLFLGHSETIQGLDLPFERLAPTIYRRL